MNRCNSFHAFVYLVNLFSGRQLLHVSLQVDSVCEHLIRVLEDALGEDTGSGGDAADAFGYSSLLYIPIRIT